MDMATLSVFVLRTFKCTPPLSIGGIRNVEFKGYIGQGIDLVAGPSILSCIKNSTFSYMFGDSTMNQISISLPQNMIKDSSVIHNDEKGRPLHILGC